MEKPETKGFTPLTSEPVDLHSPVSTSERLQAALAHGAVLFPGPGIALPALLWAMNRKEPASQGAAWVRFQSLQALAYQVLLAVAGALLGLVGLILMLVVFLIYGQRGPSGPGLVDTGTVLEIGISVFIGLLLAGLSLLGVAGGIACLAGKPFQYPWIGSQSAAYLRVVGAGDPSKDVEWLDCEHEERLMAALAHSSIMVAGMGWLAPLALWLSDRSASLWLKFQTLQSLAYQVVGMAAALVMSVFLSMTVMMMGFFAFGEAILPDQQPVEGGTTLVLALFIAASVVVVLAILAWPIYSTLPIVAAYRILKGREYVYPLVGRPVRARVELVSAATGTPARVSASQGD
jgi:uncharacterized Tic20 family protein